jgi:hypothetical protein
MRRIQRRMQVLQTHEVPSYIVQLRSQPTRWDRRAAAALGLAPQDVNTRGDNDRGADQQAGVRHVPPTPRGPGSLPIPRSMTSRVFGLRAAQFSEH